MSRVLIKESIGDFDAADENLEKIRDFLRDRLIETPLAKKEITGLLLGVEEAISNVIRHGYLYGPGNIRLRIAHDRKRVTISMVDSGRPFTWPKKGSPDYQKMIETSRKGGLGLVLIERVCDDVDYRRTPTGDNELMLTKFFADLPRTGKGFSLRWRWTATGMLISAVLAVLFFIVGNLQSSGEIRDAAFARWINLAHTTASASSNLILNRATEAEFDELALKMSKTDRTVRYVLILNTSNLILADTRGPENVRTVFQPPAGAGLTTADSPVQAEADGRAVYYLSTPIRVERGMIGRVFMAADGEALTLAQRAARFRLALYAAGGMVVLWVFSILASGWLMRPLRRLSGSVQGLVRQKGDIQSPVREGDEVQEIVNTFNQAAEQIHQSARAHFSRELARREWETAEQLQKALVMSDAPEIPGYEIGTVYRSAKYVGGDWYDLFPLDGQSFLISIADVSGKGVPGALMMATMRTAVRLLAEKHQEPSELLSAVNEFAAKHLQSGMFITMFLAVVDIRASTVHFASAGHTPMLFYRRTENKVFRVNPRGWPLGMRLPEGTSYESRLESANLPLEIGDIFVLYTDGITEARNAQKEFFGTTRLESIVAESGKSPADKIAAAIFSEVTGFTGGDARQDDMAAVVIKRATRVAAEPVLSQPRIILPSTVAETPAMKLWQSESTDLLIQSLLQVVAEHPEFDPPQICLELGRDEYHSLQMDEKDISIKLLHLKLDERKSRLEFAEWATKHAQIDSPTLE